MSLTTCLFLASCTVLSIVPPLFIWNRVYKDGLFGRIGLAGTSFFSIAFILRAWNGKIPEVDGLLVALHASIALFLIWHLWRFHRRVLRKPPYCPPECPVDRRSTPDRRFAP